MAWGLSCIFICLVRLWAYLIFLRQIGQGTFLGWLILSLQLCFCSWRFSAYARWQIWHLYKSLSVCFRRTWSRILRRNSPTRLTPPGDRTLKWQNLHLNHLQPPSRSSCSVKCLSVSSCCADWTLVAQQKRVMYAEISVASSRAEVTLVGWRLKWATISFAAENLSLQTGQVNMLRPKCLCKWYQLPCLEFSLLLHLRHEKFTWPSDPMHFSSCGRKGTFSVSMMGKLPSGLFRRMGFLDLSCIFICLARFEACLIFLWQILHRTFLVKLILFLR